MLKLYGPINPKSINTMKIRAALEEAGAAYEYVKVDLGKGEQRRPELLALNPHGKVPVLVDDDFALPESDAILWYVAERFPNAALLPADVRGRARVLQWMDFVSTGLYVAQGDLYMEKQGGPPRTSPGGESAEARLHRGYTVLEGVLADRPYVAGTALSAADLSVTACLESIKGRLGFDAARYPRIAAHLERITSRPAWQRAYAAS